MSEQIRPAVPADAAAMAALAAMRREQYARYQPRYWRPAAGVQDKHRDYLASLVASDQVISLVSDEPARSPGSSSRP